MTNIPREFTLNDVTYELDTTIKTRYLTAGFTCTVCNGPADTARVPNHDTVYSMYGNSAIYNDEDVAAMFDSMEVNIIRCVHCGQLYLETEVNDYDKMRYKPVKEKDDGKDNQ